MRPLFASTAVETNRAMKAFEIWLKEQVDKSVVQTYNV
jgi:hypothetical protein